MVDPCRTIDVPSDYMKKRSLVLHLRTVRVFAVQSWKSTATPCSRQPRPAQASLRTGAGGLMSSVDVLPDPDGVDDRRTYGGRALSARRRGGGGKAQVKTSKAMTPKDHMSADDARRTTVVSSCACNSRNSGGGCAPTLPCAAVCPSTAACSRSTSFHALSAPNHIRCEGLRFPCAMPLQ